MKVPIDDYACLNLDAPTLSAYSATVDGSTYWLVWCEYCGLWHKHGPAEGHREAHCVDSDSPYWKNGYNLALAGEFSDTQ